MEDFYKAHSCRLGGAAVQARAIGEVARGVGSFGGPCATTGEAERLQGGCVCVCVCVYIYIYI